MSLGVNLVVSLMTVNKDTRLGGHVLTEPNGPVPGVASSEWARSTIFVGYNYVIVSLKQYNRESFNLFHFSLLILNK